VSGIYSLCMFVFYKLWTYCPTYWLQFLRVFSRSRSAARRGVLDGKMVWHNSQCPGGEAVQLPGYGRYSDSAQIEGMVGVLSRWVVFGPSGRLTTDSSMGTSRFDFPSRSSYLAQWCHSSTYHGAFLLGRFRSCTIHVRVRDEALMAE
jgi:hypothetical protein